MPYNNPGSSGPGGSVIGGLLVFSVGGNNYAALPVDISGNVTANVVPRVAADAVLALLSAQDGEIATSNDSASIWVQFPNQATAKPIYALGPASQDLADFATGRIGWFPPGVTSYNFPAAGNAQFANFSALITFLNDCDFSPLADVQITLLTGAHNGAGTVFNLPNVKFIGQSVETVVITNAVVSAPTGDVYPVVFTYTSSDPTSSYGVLGIKPATDTAARLAFMGLHSVTALNTGANTISVAIQTDEPPITAATSLTGAFFHTTIANISNGTARFKNLAFLGVLKINASLQSGETGIIGAGGAEAAQIVNIEGDSITVYSGPVFASQRFNIICNDLYVGCAAGIGLFLPLPFDKIIAATMKIANCRLGGSGILCNGNGNIQAGASTIGNCDLDVDAQGGSQVRLGLYTSVNNLANATRNAFSGDGSLVTG